MKHVAIIGGRETGYWFSLAQHNRKHWEVWGLNAMRNPDVTRRWDRMFNLHRYAHLKRDWRTGLALEIAWTHLHPEVPFYVVDPWPTGSLPNQHIFPRHKLRFGRRDYHAGSFDWLLAYAIHLGTKEIALYGIGLNLESGEPISARACMEYWCGYAEAKGIKVHVAPNCDLFAQYHLVKSHTVYGYDDVRLVEDRETGGELRA